MIANLFITGLAQGLILAMVSYAVMLPFRVLNFPDLTAEGAYPLAGAVCATMLVAGVNPVTSILLASILAGCLGCLTTIISLRFKINTLLASIIISTRA